MNLWSWRLRRALPWAAVAVLACALTLLAMLPAAWIVPRFAAASGGHVRLADPVGSLWRGSATLVLTAGSDAAGATLLPGRIEWRTAFWPLLSGHVRMRMRQSEAMPEPVSLDAARRQATLAPGGIRVPASLLTGLGAPFNTLDLQGAMRLDWGEWRLFGDQAFGRLVLTLSDVASRVSRVKPLGSYRVVLDAAGRGATLQLSTLHGPLLLQGEGRLAGGAFSFQGTARAAPGARDSLLGLLNILGRRVGGDVYALSLQR